MKRFTETTKWDDPWFMDLPVKYKAFWMYICDRSDCAGIWEPNMRLAIAQIGEPMELVEILRVFEKKIEQTSDGKLWIKGFIKFQYGIELNPSNTAHLGVIRRLESNKIKPPVAIAPDKGLQRGLQAHKDKDKDKDKKEEGTGGKPKPTRKNGIVDSEWIASLKQDSTYHNINIDRELGKMINWCKVRSITPTRRRFVTWLNNAEKPLGDQASMSPQQRQNRINYLNEKKQKTNRLIKDPKNPPSWAVEELAKIDAELQKL